MVHPEQPVEHDEQLLQSELQESEQLEEQLEEQPDEQFEVQQDVVTPVTEQTGVKYFPIFSRLNERVNSDVMLKSP